jgi:hypothetical protein
MTDVEASYHNNTVEELRDELRARDLPTSGHKDELVARLEEDDATAAGTEEGEEEVAATDEVPDYYPLRVYSPYELPANTAAAQAFQTANPEAVDPTLTLDPDRQDLAVANIQDHVDTMAAAGVTVEDPRLGGGGGGGENPPEGVSVTGVTPNTGPMDTAVSITVTGTTLTGTTQVRISTPCTDLVVVDDSTVTCATPNNLKNGTYAVRVTVAGTTYDGPPFVVTQT